MNVSASKENILKKIRKALTGSTPIPFPASEGHNSVYLPNQQELEVEFAERFTQLQGKFVFCLDETELAGQLRGLVKVEEWTKVFCSEPDLKSMLERERFQGPWTQDLDQCDVAITTCEALVARTGSILLSAAQASGRTVSVYAPVHICIAYTGQLVYDVKDGLQKVREKYKDHLPSLITFATGPSRTADIEKTLVVGVHGPKEVYVFLLEK